MNYQDIFQQVRLMGYVLFRERYAGQLDGLIHAARDAGFRVHQDWDRRGVRWLAIAEAQGWSAAVARDHMAEKCAGVAA